MITLRRQLEVSRQKDGESGYDRITYLVHGPDGAVQFVYWRYEGEGARQMREIHERVARQVYGAASRPREDRYQEGSDEDGGWLVAVDLGYHARKPRYEGQEPMRLQVEGVRPNPDWKEGDSELGKFLMPTYGEPRVCEYLGVPCFYDGSGLNAAKPMQLLHERGPEAVWRMLEDYYRSTFAS